MHNSVYRNGQPFHEFGIIVQVQVYRHFQQLLYLHLECRFLILKLLYKSAHSFFYQQNLALCFQVVYLSFDHVPNQHLLQALDLTIQLPFSIYFAHYYTNKKLDLHVLTLLKLLHELLLDHILKRKFELVFCYVVVRKSQTYREFQALTY